METKTEVRSRRAREAASRRRKDPELRLTEVFKLRLTAAQYDAMCKLAYRERKPLANWLRERLATVVP